MKKIATILAASAIVIELIAPVLLSFSFVLVAPTFAAASGSAPFHGGVDVTRHGVIGDGVTDNLQALQALINSSPDGTLFYFPAGTYLVSNTVHFTPLQFFGIVGDLNPDGSPASILKSTSQNVTVADANYGNGVGSFQIRNMEFWASDQGGTGFYTQNAGSAIIENSAFKGHIGLYNFYPFVFVLRSDKFIGDGGANGSHIGYLAHLSTESLIDNCDFSGWDEGVRASGAGMSMIRSTFEHNGIGLNGGVDNSGAAWFLRASTLTGLTFSDNDVGISIKIADSIALSNIQITGSTNAPSGQSTTGLYASYLIDSQLSGMQISGSYSNAAVQVDQGSSNSSFHANTVTNSNSSGKVWNIVAGLPSSMVFDSTLLQGQVPITDNTGPSWFAYPGANIVDVTAHGVVGDNATDNAPAIQALINSASNGTVFYFPKGVYRVNSTLDFSRLTNFALVGDVRAIGGSYDGTAIVALLPVPLIKANYSSTGGTFHIRDMILRSLDTAVTSQNAVSSSIEGTEIMGNVGIRLDNPVQVSLRNLNFESNTDVRSVSFAGNNNLGIVINGGHDNTLEQVNILGYQEGIRATGDHLNLFSSRFEVNHIGLNLGVAPDGSTAPLTNSTFAGFTEEANDTGVNLVDCQTCYFEALTGQGSSNAPTGLSIVGVNVGASSQNVTFAATDFGGYFSQETLFVAPAANNVRFANSLFTSQTGTSTVVQNSSTTFGNGGVSTSPATAALSALPASITSGQSATLSWSSTNSTSCTGTNFTASGTSGSVSLAPTVTTTYTITCTGSGGSASASATVTIGNTTDTTSPTITVTAPTGTLAAGTTNTPLSVTTNENATCAYATSAGIAFASMTTFTTTGATSHTTTLSGLTNGTSYTRYIKCKDTSGNISTDTTVSFSVAASAAGTTPPPAPIVPPTTPSSPPSSPQSPTTPSIGYAMSGTHDISMPADLTAYSASPATMTLAWQPSYAPNIAGYTIYRGSVKVGTVAASVTTYTDTALASGTSYEYGVSAYDSSGNTSQQLSTIATTATGSSAAIGLKGRYIFSKPLSIGSTGIDVTALQNLLMQKGFLSVKGGPTGYFGALTFQAVKRLQDANHLEQVGSVGPKTRALLNGL